MLILSDDVENNDFPIVNNLLIGLNVLIFLLFLMNTHADDVITTWGTIPARFTAHHDFDGLKFLITSMFLHGGFLHLIGNMWFLHLFGDNVEDRLGHFTYLLFYLACGLFADFIHIFSDPYSGVPAVGASGAIAGVMGAYMVMHPGATCKTWWGDDSIFFAFKTYNVPAGVIIFGWFALQILCVSMMHGAGHIAFYAHIGGFLAGIALLCFIKHRAYQGETEEPQLYKGAGPAAGLAGFMILAWMLLSPHLKSDHVDQAPQPVHAINIPATHHKPAIKPVHAVRHKPSQHASKRSPYRPKLKLRDVPRP